MNITLLLHVLAMATLIGMSIPLLIIAKQYRETSDVSARASLAMIVIRLKIFATAALTLVVLAGVGRTFEVGYPWFDFGNAFWLAVKQIVGIALLADSVASLGKVLGLRGKLAQVKPGDIAGLTAALAPVPKLITRFQSVVGVGWILAALGVLKLTF